jgi:epoxyqueuosine reductase
MSPSDRTAAVKLLAEEIGFDRVGVASAVPIARREFFDRWLAVGFAGTMAYLHRNRAGRHNPAALLPGARAIIVAAVNYYRADASTPSTPSGRIARYALGRDYHKVVKKKLIRLVDRLRAVVDESFDAKVCVDTAPIIERELAAAAGIGWIGKNTMALHPKLGSYFFLGEIVTTLALDPDGPMVDHCGTCTRCLDACPTAAFPEPYVMNAARCISYLTIEHREEIPEALRIGMGNWLYGCDICQEVCPYNRRPPTTREPDFTPRPVDAMVDPAAVLNWSEERYREVVRGSAMKRATLSMWKRNAAVVLGNRGKTTPAPTSGLPLPAPGSDRCTADPPGDTPGWPCR